MHGARGDWDVVEAAAKRAGWQRTWRPEAPDDSQVSELLKKAVSPRGWRGPCPVHGEFSCTVEYGEDANDRVLMRCFRPGCIALDKLRGYPAGQLGKVRYEQHKDSAVGPLIRRSRRVDRATLATWRT